ncbi:hypothetical protein N9043_01105 [bacterium]|nr:hypothetical protein [bacterium]
MGKLDILKVFKNSFYSGYFMHVPDQIICSALEQVKRDCRMDMINCPHLFEEMFELKSALFLNSFFGSTELSYTNNDGEVVSVKSLSTTGAKSNIKKDSVDSSVSREYFEPSFMEGEDASDFPLGYIKEQLSVLKDQCESLNSITMGIGADVPCGTDHCKPMDRYLPNVNTNIRKCLTCR